MRRAAALLVPLALVASTSHAEDSVALWGNYFKEQSTRVIEPFIRVTKDLPAVLKGAEAVILAVPHAPYIQLDPADVVKWAGGPLAVIDCFGILDDESIARYFELGCEVKALGRGHIQRIKEEVRSRKK